MSYNIDTWRTKQLDGLTIPLAELRNHGDWFDNPQLNEDDTLTITGGAERFEMIGRRDGDMLHVTEIDCSGEGSGRHYDVLTDVFAKSTGTLVASLVWEGGDSITRLTVKDGVVSSENIEI